VQKQLESSGKINREARADRWELRFTQSPKNAVVSIFSYKTATTMTIKWNQVNFRWANGHDLTINGVNLNSPQDAERVVRIANIINLLRSKPNVRFIDNNKLGEFLGWKDVFISSKNTFIANVSNAFPKWTEFDTKIIYAKEIIDLWVDPKHLDKYLQEIAYQKETEKNVAVLWNTNKPQIPTSSYK
jgi:hypothetical protein